MNPNFRNIHFGSDHPQLLRLDELTLKFWAKSEVMSQYCLLIDMTLSMRSLQFIGKSVSFSYNRLIDVHAYLVHLAIEFPPPLPSQLYCVSSDRWLLYCFH